MELSDSSWINLLSKEYSPGRESVIITVGRLPRTLQIRKDDWQNHFSEFDGIEVIDGDEIEVAPRKDGAPKAPVPDRARERLASGSSDAVCITRRDGKYYLKKLELVEDQSQIPVCMIVDKFEKDRVERTYWNRMELDGFTDDVNSRLLSAMPRLRYDPIEPFENVKGRIGFLARKEFFGGFTKADEVDIEDYKKEICQDQQPDGNWEDSAVKTGFKLIRLLEVGASLKEESVEKAVNWLLNAREPLGFPGLYMIAEKTTDSFNAWKQKQEPGSRKRGSRSSTAAQQRIFIENKDVFGASNAYCEVKFTWTNAVVLEALLRCGLYHEPRVVKAINTLLSMSHGSGGWCGCGYFVADIYHPESTAPIDFNNVNIRMRGHSPGSLGLNREDILRMGSNYSYRGLDFGDNRTLVVRRGVEGSGDCPMVIHRALSYHPAYHGTKMETMAAIHCSHRQGWLGDWTDNYASFFFSLLERAACPLSGYLALRSIPILVRQQREDGFWQEDAVMLRKPIPTPTPEESTFMIAKALKTFGFLETLRPA